MELNLGGAQSTNNNIIRNFVGLGAVTLVAVNPNKKQLEKILGREIQNDPDYSINEDNNGVKTRPLSFWFDSNGKIFSERIYIGNSAITTKNGDKFKFINSVGQISYYASSAEDIANNPKVSKWYSPNGMRKLLIGEDILYSMLQNFVRYNPKEEGANWMEVMNNIGCTGENLFQGNYEGLNKFIEYINSNNNMLIVLHAINRRETEDGVRYNQKLILRDDTMFRTTDGEVMEWMINKLKDYESNQLSAGYSITNADYKCCALEEYNPKEFEAEQDVPSDTATLLSL
jgi:hypothetical protein